MPERRTLRPVCAAGDVGQERGAVAERDPGEIAEAAGREHGDALVDAIRRLLREAAFDLPGVGDVRQEDEFCCVGRNGLIQVGFLPVDIEGVGFLIVTLPDGRVCNKLFVDPENGLFD
jgi:hypothetical protein